MTKAILWQAVVATLILLVPLGWMAGSMNSPWRTDLSILLKPAVSTQGLSPWRLRRVSFPDFSGA